MKKVFYILIILSITFSFGCKRYPDGPLISLRSPEKRIVGEWQIIGFISNGVDSLQYCIDSCVSGMGIAAINPLNSSNFLEFSNGLIGDWTFSDNKTIMNVSLTSGVLQPIHGLGPFKAVNYYEEWKILKLEMKKLEISTTSNGRNYLISFNK